MRLRAFGSFASILALAFATCANADEPKKPSDTDIAKFLVGKWAVDESSGQVKIKGFENYKKDGTIEAEATYEIPNKPPLKIALAGTWKVSDGVIIATVTKSSAPELIKVGLVSKDTVVSIDDKEYKYKSEGGEEKSHKRIKE